MPTPYPAKPHPALPNPHSPPDLLKPQWAERAIIIVMSELTTACPTCDSNLYGVVKVYVRDDETGRLTMQELDDSEVMVQCENESCSVSLNPDALETHDLVDEFSDQVVGFLVRANAAVASLGDIATAMSGQEWNADTLDRIAQIVRNAGFEINDIPDPDLANG